MKSSTLRKIAARAQTPILVVEGAPLNQWVSYPLSDEELKALVNTMMFAFEVRAELLQQKSKSEFRKWNDRLNRKR
jgi:hypothetical protein